ncbi:polysaccharide deacetylase family protein [Chitinophagaceae bacterium MMS25-I14]
MKTAIITPDIRKAAAVKKTYQEPETSLSFNGKLDSLPHVLVLCYHQVRDWTATDSKSARTYIVSVGRFEEQIAGLHDKGYVSILPDQLAGYMLRGAPLPPKAVLLTFDDGTESQITNALPVVDRYGYKATFFIMTVTLGKPGYMSRAQVRMLADKGHTIGCHTWDHHIVTGYTAQDWTTQLVKPTLMLEQITGKPVRYFAYPYGIWNATAIEHLKALHYTAAFQLAGHEYPAEPMFCIRRIIADSKWKTK